MQNPTDFPRHHSMVNPTFSARQIPAAQGDDLPPGYMQNAINSAQRWLAARPSQRLIPTMSIYICARRIIPGRKSTWSRGKKSSPFTWVWINFVDPTWRSFVEHLFPIFGNPAQPNNLNSIESEKNQIIDISSSWPQVCCAVGDHHWNSIRFRQVFFLFAQQSMFTFWVRRSNDHLFLCQNQFIPKFLKYSPHTASSRQFHPFFNSRNSKFLSNRRGRKERNVVTTGM